MNEQRRQVLRMLADGKITTDEAERLICALERERPAPRPGDALGGKARPKYLRVMVDTADDSSPEGAFRLNIRVPLQLLRAGVRLTTFLPPPALTKVNEQLTRSGVPVDLTELKPRQLEELVDQLDEMTVSMDEPDSRVRVFCE